MDNIVGLSLEEALLFGEKENYDFKEILPDNKKLSSEVSAFANIKNGGIILVGISDDGEILGVHKDEVDEIQLRFCNS